jgi:hypothetical protein
MKWNKVPRLGALEEAQCISRREMSFPKAWLPPRGVANWQQCDIELALLFGHVLVNDTIRMIGEGGITREEDGMLLGKQKIHVSGRPPAINAVPASIVLRWRCLDTQTANRYAFLRRERLRMAIASTS